VKSLACRSWLCVPHVGQGLRLDQKIEAHWSTPKRNSDTNLTDTNASPSRRNIYQCHLPHDRIAKHTVLKLLKDMGCAAAYHHEQVRNLRVRRVQCDEIYRPLQVGKSVNSIVD